jgi:hypothetical protein
MQRVWRLLARTAFTLLAVVRIVRAGAARLRG